MIEPVGHTLGQYRLLRQLGQGSFAAVYLAEHHYLERPAAIKVLHMRMQRTSHDAFRREARTIARLQHPHIISVYDFGIQDDVPYLVMEYLAGGTLRQAHPKGTRLTHEQIVDPKMIVIVERGSLPRTATKGNVQRKLTEEKYREVLDGIFSS